MNEDFLWQANKDEVEKSNLYSFCKYLDKKKFFP